MPSAKVKPIALRPLRHCSLFRGYTTSYGIQIYHKILPISGTSVKRIYNIDQGYSFKKKLSLCNKGSVTENDILNNTRCLIDLKRPIQLLWATIDLVKLFLVFTCKTAESYTTGIAEESFSNKKLFLCSLN